MNIKGGGRVPIPPAGASTAAKVLLLGGAVFYAATNCLYNVEGGHRATVFNRIQGIKDRVLTHVSFTPPPPLSLSTPMCAFG
jgi:prohibitin 2